MTLPVISTESNTNMLKLENSKKSFILFLKIKNKLFYIFIEFFFLIYCSKFIKYTRNYIF